MAAAAGVNASSVNVTVHVPLPPVSIIGGTVLVDSLVVFGGAAAAQNFSSALMLPSAPSTLLASVG
eukprot:821120-Pyramimonas_sp.AAC.1